LLKRRITLRKLAEGVIRRLQRVGWVERSDTHQLLFIALTGFADTIIPAQYAEPIIGRAASLR
jgi:hypothetical protein